MAGFNEFFKGLLDFAGDNRGAISGLVVLLESLAGNLPLNLLL